MENLSLTELKELQKLTFDKIVRVNKLFKATEWAIKGNNEVLEDEDYIDDWLKYKESLNRNTKRLEELRLDIVNLNNLYEKIGKIIELLEA